MFTGEANEAMKTYVEIFSQAKIVNVERYGRGFDGPEGLNLV